MTDAVETTRWSLPGGTDLPMDELKVQLEVYNETILLRGFESETTWVRTVSADEIANVFTRHLGFASGCCHTMPSGGTRARPDRWWPSGGPRRSGRWPCNGRRSSHPHGSGFPCRGWSSSARRGRAPWVYAGMGRPTDPEQHLFRALAFNVFRDGRVCPGSHRFREELGLIPEGFFQSFFSLTGDTRDSSKKHPDNLIALWEEIDGKTEYPMEDLVPQCTVAHAMAVSEGRRATASAKPGPVGYLVNHPAGLAGVQGIGYDYVLGSGGVYVQSRSAHLTARIPVSSRPISSGLRYRASSRADSSTSTIAKR